MYRRCFDNGLRSGSSGRLGSRAGGNRDGGRDDRDDLGGNGETVESLRHLNDLGSVLDADQHLRRAFDAAYRVRLARNQLNILELDANGV